MPIRVVTKGVRYIHELSLTLEHSMPISSPAAPGLTHLFTVVSSFPLGEIVHNREVTGRIAKWLVELMGETLTYAPHKAVKSQILADFIAEWTNT